MHQRICTFCFYAATSVVLLSGCHSGKISEGAQPLAQQRSPFRAYKDLRYGTDTAQQTLDVYLPVVRSIQSTPVVILLHGGAWVQGTKNDFNGIGVDTFFTSNGFAVVNMNYRLDKTYAYPAPVDDIGMVMDYIRLNAVQWNVNANSVCILGTSSGAHLALIYAYTRNSNKRIKAVIDLHGPSNLTDSRIVNTPLYTNITELLGPYATNQDKWHEASPIFHIDGAVPTIIFQGSLDSVIYPYQSQMLGDSLLAHNIPCMYVPCIGFGHGWMTGCWIDNRDITLQWIKKFM